MKIAISAIALIVALFLSAGCASAATHYRYEDVVRNTSGRVVSGATCTVRAVSDSSLATLYTGPTLLTQAINPVTTDVYGRFGFYINPGRYFIEIKRAGVVDYAQFGVDIVDVPVNGAPVIYGAAPNPSTTNFPGLLLYNSFGQSFAFWDGSDWISIRDASDPGQIVASPTLPDTVGQRGLVWYDQTNDDLFLYTGVVGRELLSTTVTGGSGATGDSMVIRVPAHDMMDDITQASFSLYYAPIIPPAGFGRAMVGAAFPWLDNIDGDELGRGNFVVEVPDNYVAGTSFNIQVEFASLADMTTGQIYTFECGVDVMRRYWAMDPAQGVLTGSLRCINNEVLLGKIPAAFKTGTTIDATTILTTYQHTITPAQASDDIVLAAGDKLLFYIERTDVIEANLIVLAVDVKFDVQ